MQMFRKFRPGNEEPKEDTVFGPGRRRRMNVVAVFIMIFVPWILFSLLFALLSFNHHYTKPVETWILVGVAFAFVLCTIIMAYKSRKTMPDPSWFTFMAIVTVIAWGGAVSLGDMNFWYNMQPYYSLMHLNEYEQIDPARVPGQSVLDAGRIAFSPGSRLDRTKAMSFRNLDSYCVAPIVSGDDQTFYDFWAAGINCCSGIEPEFRCGEYKNINAHEGVRIMRPDWRQFFRYAVEQAESVYGIKSYSPLFFFWVADFTAELNAYRDDGFKYFLLAIFTHFSFNLMLVVFASVGFLNIGARLGQEE